MTIEGTATFKEINDDLDMPYRRSSDILNGKIPYNNLFFI